MDVLLGFGLLLYWLACLLDGLFFTLLFLLGLVLGGNAWFVGSYLVWLGPV